MEEVALLHNITLISYVWIYINHTYLSGLSCYIDNSDGNNAYPERVLCSTTLLFLKEYEKLLENLHYFFFFIFHMYKLILNLLVDM